MKLAHLVDWGAFLFVIIVWGGTYSSTRVLVGAFSSLEIQYVRFAMAWLALCLAGRGTFACRDGRDRWLAAGMGLTGVAAYQFLENGAIFYTNASTVAIFVTIGPVVTAVLAYLLLGDRTLSARFLLGAALAAVGVGLVTFNGVVHLALDWKGCLMAFAAMICWGFYSVLLDAANRRGIAPLVAVRRAFFWALVWMLPLAVFGLTAWGQTALDGVFRMSLWRAADWARFGSLPAWGHFLFLGLFASAAAFAAWSRACRALGMVRASVGLYLIPVAGVLFAAFFLKEPLTPLGCAGAACVLGGVVLATARRKPRAPRDSRGD